LFGGRQRLRSPEERVMIPALPLLENGAVHLR
jgi:hypothetical protein